MTLLKRWSAALISRIDAAVTQIENHEAVVDGAIHEVRRQLARARVQLGRIRQDRERLDARLQQARADAETWAERARRSAATDESQALECLRRRRRAQTEATSLETQLADQDRLETRLGGDVRQVEERLARLQLERNRLRTRESTAAALGAVDAASSPLGADVDEILERWEIRVTEHELTHHHRPDRDPLAEHFAGAEEEAALRAELAALMGPQEKP